MKSKSKSKRFPDPRLATADGLVAVGGDLSADTLIEAYQNGIFPWPQPGMPLLWFSPDPRGVLDFSDLHIPDSLKKWERKNPHWKFTINRAFTQVIEQCRLQPRPGQDGTWILQEMESAYTELFNRGAAMSLECWEGEALIGGIYGVLTQTKNNKILFSGESMFHLKPNASKMCLWKIIEHLKLMGHSWIDIQMTTEVTTAMGGKLISKEEYLQRIGV
jgi:leucyl/phenylalanyl-tRNA--protein transferase